MRILPFESFSKQVILQTPFKIACRTEVEIRKNNQISCFPRDEPLVENEWGTQASLTGGGFEVLCEAPESPGGFMMHSLKILNFDIV